MVRLTLGIECTAHTFGAAVIRDKDVLSNVKDAYTNEKGGMIPVKIAEHHIVVCHDIVQRALDDAGVSIKDIGLVSYSQGPGFGHTLRIGTIVARSLSVLHGMPIIGVNHCVAHLEVGRMQTTAQDPVLLYASGANTQVIAYEGGKYRVFGETLDTGIGNFLDTLARYMGLGFPGGPKLMELAADFDDASLHDSSLFRELSYGVKGMDLTFTGLLSQLKKMFDDGVSSEEVAYYAQEYAFAMLVEVSERAMAHTKKTELLLGGGVACNTRLQQMARLMCEGRGATCFVLENQFNVDNAAMIAWLGYIEYMAGKRTTLDDPVRPYERTDDVSIFHR